MSKNNIAVLMMSVFYGNNLTPSIINTKPHILMPAHLYTLQAIQSI